MVAMGNVVSATRVQALANVKIVMIAHTLILRTTSFKETSAIEEIATALKDKCKQRKQPRPIEVA